MRRSAMIMTTMAAGLMAAGAGAEVKTAVFISPMGEPFRGASAAEQLRAWFNGADANRDGGLSQAEMRVDAERFFGVLNSNRDREIDPTELRIYEEQVAPEIRVGFGGMARSSGPEPMPRSGMQSPFGQSEAISRRVKRDTSRRGAGLYGLLGIPNPVASTDSNLNRGISPEEFARAARDRFALLDTNRDGAVRFEELPALPQR